MAIKTPKWLPKGAYPTHGGWVSAKGEVLKKQKISSADLIEWHQATTQEVAPIQMLTEAPSVQSELSQETIAHYYYSTQAEETSAQDTDEDM